jgi:hypothetical protein
MGLENPRAHWSKVGDKGCHVSFEIGGFAGAAQALEPAPQKEKGGLKSPPFGFIGLLRALRV